jgi:flagellin FlaB
MRLVVEWGIQQYGRKQTMSKWKSLEKFKDFGKDEKAFTGLEAAIVLTAFVVVAAVFSYVVLGAGFFTSDKAKEVVHTGVEQATSSTELSGDVIAKNKSSTEVGYILLTVQLTAGQSPVDMRSNKMVISYFDKSQYEKNATWTATWIKGSGDMLDSNEKAEINVTVPGSLTKNMAFTLEVKPPMGSTLPVTRTIPGAVDRVMNLH